MEFSNHKKRPDGLQADCKKCQKEYRKQHYVRNKEKYLDRARERNDRARERNVRFLRTLKRFLKCSICEENHPSCLQFHHRNPKKKIGCISELINRAYSLKMVKTEIKKCDVLCANCHFKHHYNEKEKED